MLDLLKMNKIDKKKREKKWPALGMKKSKLLQST